MKVQKVLLIILFTGLFISDVLSFFNARSTSYQKYIDGEYEFRYHAETIGGSGGVPSGVRDANELRTLLLASNDVDVYVSDPDGQTCTVYYDNVMIEDYPIARLSIDEDDLDYFLGKKVYTEQEYALMLSRLSDEDIEAGAINDKEAKHPLLNGYKTDFFFMISLFALILFILMGCLNMDIGFYIAAVFLGVINIVWVAIIYL